MKPIFKMKKVEELYTKLKENKCIRTGFLTCKVPKNRKHKHKCRITIQKIHIIMREDKYDKRN